MSERKKKSKDPRIKQHLLMRAEVRGMKMRGMTTRAVADSLGISRGLAHYYSRGTPGENVCPRCCQPFKK